MSGLVNSTNAPSESDEALPGAADNGPSGVSPLAPYLLGLADDVMVYAQRLSEWMTNAPQIEEDMALGNIALDLLGQARALYPYIGSIDGTGRGEDDFAMLRDERGSFFDPAADKIYRHPTFYDVPEGVEHL